MEGVGVVSILLWLPAGLSAGEWYAVADSASTHAEGPFEFEAYDGPALSAIPDTDINPFEYHSSGSYSAGDVVVIRGTNFEPDAEVPLGIYYCSHLYDQWELATPEVEGADTHGVLVYSEMVMIDDQGDFSTLIRIEPSSPTGTYVAVTAVTAPKSSVYGMYDQEIAIYHVVR